ncbi:hypothetical protein ACF1BQ_020610 [Bradyrhizobium sp. RDT10]
MVRAATLSHSREQNFWLSAATGDFVPQKRRKINERALYPAAHNGLVAGSSPAGLTRKVALSDHLKCPLKFHDAIAAA